MNREPRIPPSSMAIMAPWPPYGSIYIDGPNQPICFVSTRFYLTGWAASPIRTMRPFIQVGYGS